MEKSRQGFALLIVLGILTLLSLMAGSFALTMRRENGVTFALKNNAAVTVVAESGLTLAMYMLQLPDPEQRWLVDGTVYRFLRKDGGEVRISIVSESGKVDVNTGNEKQLLAIVKAVTGGKWDAENLVNKILDWRDEDNEVRPHGAEKQEYIDAGLSYTPSNKPFQSLEELQMLLGMDEAIFAQLQPWLTVYSGQSEVNLSEATPEVLEIISNDLTTRNVQNSTAQQALGNNSQPGGNQLNAGSADNKNGAYTITIEVHMEDGASASLEAVTRLPSPDSGLSGYPILDWKQNQLTRSLFANAMDSRLITVQDEFTNNN